MKPDYAAAVVTVVELAFAFGLMVGAVILASGLIGCGR